ncbi:helix-turn-helix domain-containing protein [Breznakia pachnodae]|uniref:DNA-binding Xre family transcriptional regulator n=1 Tax=Breznakia pachnodae TaxID=265178 RepID=A0ABU0E8K0_9FIRM|nr:helix-turn-helix transcriptional regulator [Breznakia pachnodae]MDQ0363219.1 DNA-binding Xre family transcriptional regulator [Breznakia pachnodae]
MRKKNDERLTAKVIEVRYLIYHYLDQSDISLRKLAANAGLNYHAVWKLLNNPPEDTNFTLKTLLSIADALEVAVADLVCSERKEKEDIKKI